MKKTTLFPAALVAVLFSFSCQKDLENTPLPPDGGKGVMVAKNSSLSPGEIHNLVLEEYIALYGLDPDEEMTLGEAQTMGLQIAGISEAHGFLDETDANTCVNMLLQCYQEQGFVENNVFKTPSEINALSIQNIENPELKSALTQINALAEAESPHFLQESLQILSQLTTLNSDEQIMVNGFRSVVVCSGSLWDKYNDLTHKCIVYLADAVAFVNTYSWAVKTGSHSSNAFYLALADAEIASAKAAKAYK